MRTHRPQWFRSISRHPWRTRANPDPEFFLPSLGLRAVSLASRAAPQAGVPRRCGGAVARLVSRRARRESQKERDRWGQHLESRKAESDLIRVAKPEWRIVSDALWHAAHKRFRTRHATFHGGAGRPRQQQDRESRYLLPSFARCTVCGSGICVTSRDSGGRRLFAYRCSANHKKGAEISLHPLPRMSSRSGHGLDQQCHCGDVPVYRVCPYLGGRYGVPVGRDP